MITLATTQRVQVLTDSEGRLWGITDEDWEQAFQRAGGPDDLRRFAEGHCVAEVNDSAYAFDFSLIRDDLGLLTLSGDCYPTDVDGEPVRGGGRLGSAVLYCAAGGFGGQSWEDGKPDPVVQTISCLLAREHNGEFVMVLGHPEWTHSQMLHGGRCLPMRAMRTLYRYLWDSNWNKKEQGVFPSMKGYKTEMQYLFLRAPARLICTRYQIRFAAVPGVDNTWVMYAGDGRWSDNKVISSGFRMMEHEARNLARELWDEARPQSEHGPLFDKPEFLRRKQVVDYRA